MSKKSSTFAPAFREFSSPHGSLGTQTSGVFVDRRAEAQVARRFSEAVSTIAHLLPNAPPLWLSW